MFPKNVSQNVHTFRLNLEVWTAYFTNIFRLFSAWSLFSKSEIGRLFLKKYADFKKNI